MPLTRPTSASSPPGSSGSVLELSEPTYTTPSAGDYVIGGYHDFDGTDERIEFGAIPALEFDASDTFTISFWGYKDTNTSFGAVCSYNHGTSGSGDGEGWLIGWGANNASVSLVTYDGSSYSERGFLTPALNTWHHVMFVFNAGSISFYLNGNSASQAASTGTLFNNITYASVTDARIGARQTASGFFPGRIAEVAIWSSDQSANVAAIYNSRARHDLMDLATPPDLFYAPLTSYGDDPGSGGSVAEVVANNNGTGVNMETADAVIPTPTTVTSTLTKALDIATSVVTTTKVENVASGGAGTGGSFP